MKMNKSAATTFYKMKAASTNGVLVSTMKELGEAFNSSSLRAHIIALKYFGLIKFKENVIGEKKPLSFKISDKNPEDYIGRKVTQVIVKRTENTLKEKAFYKAVKALEGRIANNSDIYTISQEFALGSIPTFITNLVKKGFIEVNYDQGNNRLITILKEMKGA